MQSLKRRDDKLSFLPLSLIFSAGQNRVGLSTQVSTAFHSRREPRHSLAPRFVPGFRRVWLCACTEQKRPELLMPTAFQQFLNDTTTYNSYSSRALHTIIKQTCMRFERCLGCPFIRAFFQDFSYRSVWSTVDKLIFEKSSRVIERRRDSKETGHGRSATPIWPPLVRYLLPFFQSLSLSLVRHVVTLLARSCQSRHACTTI